MRDGKEINHERMVEMGLITKEVEVGLNFKDIKHYENLGYIMPRRKTKWGRFSIPIAAKIIVKVEDLVPSSHASVEVKCDRCGEERFLEWCDYNKGIKKNGGYFCYNCVMELYGIKNIQLGRLKNGKSFEQWCYDNLQQEEAEEILSRWDYELNNGVKPSEINYGTEVLYYFKCPKGIHDSESKMIHNFISGQKGSMYCKKCNTFAQHLIDLYGDNALNLYWDYEQNDKLNLDPWEITKYSNDTKVWIKCQNGHKSYFVGCDKFAFDETRCPICRESKGEKRIKEYLDNNKINYISQKKFEGLVGLGNRKLSYDYYLPDYNLLIEFQGKFHDGTAKKQTKKDFEKQQEHDRRKCEYAKNNNINLLEIWYWDIKNINNILSEQI
jgi:hypothetical protein